MNDFRAIPADVPVSDVPSSWTDAARVIDAFAAVNPDLSTMEVAALLDDPRIRRAIRETHDYLDDHTIPF